MGKKKRKNQFGNQLQQAQKPAASSLQQDQKAAANSGSAETLGRLLVGAVGVGITYGLLQRLPPELALPAVAPFLVLALALPWLFKKAIRWVPVMLLTVAYVSGLAYYVYTLPRMPLQVQKWEVHEYKEGERPKVNVHVLNRDGVPLDVVSVSAMIVRRESQGNTNYQIGETFWQQFHKGLSDQKAMNHHQIPPGDSWFTIPGWTPLTKDEADTLRKDQAKLFFVGLINGTSGAMSYCAFAGADRRVVNLCQLHNGLAPRVTFK
jgi:hypothetical protein